MKRKTFTIYGKKAARDNTSGVQHKRKLELEQEDVVSKQHRIKEEDSSSSSDEEEAEDAMKQLRETFGGSYVKKAVSAIESSSDSDFEEDEEENDIIKAEESDADNSVEETQTEPPEEEENAEEDEETVNDMFTEHFHYDLSENMLKNLQNPPVVADNLAQNWPCLGKLLIQIPKCEEETQTNENIVNISGDKKKAACGKNPRILKAQESLAAVKVQIRHNVAKRNVNSGGSFTPLQNEMFSVLNNYQDFLYSQRTLANAEELRFIYCVHVVNHVLKTRMKVLHHNARLNKKEDVPEEFRDQGLVRPKVRIVF